MALKAIKRFDFYRKIPMDLTEPTTPGALISIVCFCFMTYLLCTEFIAFTKLQESSEMFIQQEEGMFEYKAI